MNNLSDEQMKDFYTMLAIEYIKTARFLMQEFGNCFCKANVLQTPVI